MNLNGCYVLQIKFYVRDVEQKHDLYFPCAIESCFREMVRVSTSAYRMTPVPAGDRHKSTSSHFKSMIATLCD